VPINEFDKLLICFAQVEENLITIKKVGFFLFLLINLANGDFSGKITDILLTFTKTYKRL